MAGGTKRGCPQSSEVNWITTTQLPLQSLNFCQDASLNLISSERNLTAFVSVKDEALGQLAEPGLSNEREDTNGLNPELLSFS
jgi:hypothetical protein